MKPARLLLLALLAVLPLHAQRPVINDARVTAIPSAGDLGAQIRGAGAEWVAYSVPAIAGHRVSCCWDGGSWRNSNCECSLSGSNSGSFNINSDDASGPHVEQGLTIFYRVTNRAIDRIRIFSSGCTIDADGASVAYLENVSSRQSVALLASLLDDDEERVGKRALGALALHQDEAATDQLINLLRSNQGTELRGHAAFWLGSTRGRRGYDVVHALAGDASQPVKLREKAVFAMTQSKQPDAVDDLIDLAKRDPDSRVRGQAIFWLSQKAGKKAAAAIRDAVDNDPNEEVKTKAVFAISQLPDEESIPLLSDLLRSHKSPAVRKKAAFWLGQKKDPRALEVLEEILRR